VTHWKIKAEWLLVIRPQSVALSVST